MRGKEIALVVAILLAACTAPMDAKIDASSMDAFQRSMQALQSRLTAEESKQFGEAVLTITMEAGFARMFAGAGKPDAMQTDMLSTINGKSPRELIALAEHKKHERAEAELKSIRDEIAALEKAKQDAQKGAALLSKIVIDTPRFYWDKIGYMSVPVIDFTVKNGMALALSRIYYHGMVSTPGRSVPWIDSDFNNEMHGGLEPGEEKHLELNPNPYLGWGVHETEGRDDLVFTVTVVNAETADKTKLSADFSKKDAERLEQLRKMKSDLEQSTPQK